MIDKQVSENQVNPTKFHLSQFEIGFKRLTNRQFEQLYILQLIQ